MLIVFFLSCFAMVVLRNAWVCDDAYISFRTVDNFVNGYGLTWNVSERVQSFTHPLWVIILSPIYLITNEIYFTVVFVSLALSLAALSIFAFRSAKTAGMAGLGILILTLSDAFVDYSTSGLENPLSFLIVAIFLQIYFRGRHNIRSFACLSMLAALGAVNRFDLLVFFGPILVYLFWSIRSRRAVLTALIGFIPLIIWEIFSLLYYGFPFPNTAYAKLCTGLDQSIMFSQAFWYIVNSIKIDPLTMAVIATAIIVPFLIRDRRGRPVSVALAATIGYLFVIGGCFMSGRMFAVPLLAAVILLAQYGTMLSRTAMALAVVLILLLGLTTPYSPVLTDPKKSTEGFKLGNGVTDERAYYNPTNGLMNYDRFARQWPSHGWANRGIRARQNNNRNLIIGTIGMTGFYAGPEVHILDILALTDPLMSRLPVLKQLNYKIGHYRRVVPPGYDTTLVSGDNLIVDSSLALYYDKLSILTRDPVFSWSRMVEIVKFNLGWYDELIDNYSSSHMITARLSDISRPRPQGTNWLEAGNFVFDSCGIEIDLEIISHAPYLEISRDHNDDLAAVYLLRGTEIARQSIPGQLIESGGLVVSTFSVPPEAVESGYDRLQLLPESGDNRYSLGHICPRTEKPDTSTVPVN